MSHYTYGVTVQVVFTVDGGRVSRGVPYFRVVASSHDGAKRIAAEIVNPAGNPDLELHITTVERA